MNKLFGIPMNDIMVALLILLGIAARHGRLGRRCATA